MESLLNLWPWMVLAGVVAIAIRAVLDPKFRQVFIDFWHKRQEQRKAMYAKLYGITLDERDNLKPARLTVKPPPPMNWLAHTYEWWLRLPAWARFISCWPLILIMVIIPFIQTIPDFYFIHISHQSEFVSCLPAFMPIWAFYAACFLVMTNYRITITFVVCSISVLVAIFAKLTDPLEMDVWDYTYLAVWNVFALSLAFRTYRNPYVHKSGTFFRFYAAILIITGVVTGWVYLIALIRAAWWPIQGPALGIGYITFLAHEISTTDGFFHVVLPILIEAGLCYFGFFLWRSISHGIPDLPEQNPKGSK